VPEANILTARNNPYRKGQSDLQNRRIRAAVLADGSRKGHNSPARLHSPRPGPAQQPGTDLQLDDSHDEFDDKRTVFVIIGRAFAYKGSEPSGIHILLAAPDDDSAVREALNALAQEGYEEAELDQIGVLDGMPDEEPYASAYQGALEGEIAIVTV
jgi:hypothetical protein